MALNSIDTKDAVIAVLASVILIPLVSWAFRELWKIVRGDQTSVAHLVQDIAKEMRTGFQELRDFGTSQRLEHRETSIRVTHVEQALVRLEQRLDKVDTAATELERRLTKRIETGNK